MSFTPYQPTLLAASGVPSAVTGTTSKTALATIVVKGGLVGPRDQLEIYAFWSYTNSANSKTLTFTLGASNIANFASTTTQSIGHITWWANRSSSSSQVLNPISTGSFLGNLGGAGTTALNTLGNLTLTINGTLANSGETIQLEFYYIKVWKFL